jgi:hypothetical protein
VNDPEEYVRGETIGVKLSTVTGTGQLPLGSSPTTSVVMSARAFSPYPPGNVQINGQYFPATPQSEINVTWASRNRVQQTGGILLGFLDGSVTPEPGTRYKLVLKDSVGTPVLSEEDLTGLSYTVPSGIISTLGGSATVELSAVRDGYESFQKHVIPLLITADYGDNLEFIMDEFQPTPPSGDSLNFIMDENS